MFFDQRYHVTSATILPVEVIETASRESGYVAARLVTATKALLARGTDITDRFAASV